MLSFNDLCSFQVLYNAHKQARLGKRNRTGVIQFEMDLATNLTQLSQELQNGTYKVGSYYQFKVYDPKQRVIHALRYRDRVLQHALCDNILQPYFENRLIYDNAACRVGKGTHFAMDRLSQFIHKHYTKYGTNGYFLKCDISKFFYNIDHAVLKAMLAKCNFQKPVLDLCNLIIDSHIHNPNCSTSPKGLPLGNQTSQFFALFYLDPIDRLIKEKLRIKYYTRYMDDFVLLHHDKVFLVECLHQITQILQQNLLLTLNPKTQIIPLSKGVQFVGFQFTVNPKGKILRLLPTARKYKTKRLIRKLQAIAQAIQRKPDPQFTQTPAIKANQSHNTTRPLKTSNNSPPQNTPDQPQNTPEWIKHYTQTRLQSIKAHLQHGNTHQLCKQYKL